MYRLLLIRHAKSSWQQPQLTDHQRPLNNRGRRDAPVMAEWLQQQQEPIDAIYSSVAVRATSLAEIIAAQLGLSVCREAGLFTFSAQQLLAELQSLPDTEHCVAVVAHNPALTELLNDLTSESMGNMPTAAIAALDCDIDSWQQLTDNCGTLDYMFGPKDLVG
jgi:phosphohistidine phosphatase